MSKSGITTFRRFLRRIRGLGGIGSLKYRVIDPGTTVAARYHNSTGNFFDEVRGRGGQPAGIRYIGGGDEFIDVDYDKDTVTRAQIEDYIRACGIKTELVYWSEEHEDKE